MANPTIEYTCSKCKRVRVIQRKTAISSTFTGICIGCAHDKGINTVAGTRLHSVWAGMKTRCLNPAASNYSYYGGRGITVCDRWLEYENFRNDIGNHPGKGWTLERIDNEGPYSPENCRWAKQAEQNNNTRQNHWIEFAGKKQTLNQWAEDTGLDRHTLSSRLHRLGWSVERALTTRARRLNRR